MNSEELEQSLRSEFDSHMRSVLAELKQETAELQDRLVAEFEKQRSQMNEAFTGFMARFDSERPSDAAFAGSVAEHLRLARDEGARIAADAMVQAENLGQSPLTAVPAAAPAPAKYDAIRDAVSDISAKDSQSSILRSLVHHASGFASRGAFFIIKSDNFSGWKVFGGDSLADDSIRDIRFPVSSATSLGEAVSTMSTVERDGPGTSGDAAFLTPLQFSGAAKMVAIPLVARGRAVAVLYADQGEDAGETAFNRDALETLVRVAGLTVELLASTQTLRGDERPAPADFENVGSAGDEAPAPTPSFTEPVSPPIAEPQPRYEFEEAPAAAPSVPVFAEPEAAPTQEQFGTPAVETSVPVFDDSPSYGFPSEPVSSNPFASEAAPAMFDERPSEIEADAVGQESAPQPVPAFDENPFAEQPYPGDEAIRQAESVFEPARSETFEPVSETVESFEAPEPANSGAMVFDSGQPFVGETAPLAAEKPREQFEPAVALSGTGGFAPQPDPVIEAPVVKAPQPRLSERNVDLPIEVPEEERRIHNDARRFARLLVSEIKLYNEKKVVEGRESSDLYERLREAIDRSREMYDKRVQPPVAAKFDYFHYELVNSLAEGNAAKLGNGYPGATV